MAIWILYSTATMLEITTPTSNMGNKITLLTTKVLLSVFSEHLNFYIIQL